MLIRRETGAARRVIGALAVVREARGAGGASRSAPAGAARAGPDLPAAPAAPAVWFWGLVAAGVALDQITKLVVMWRFELHERVPVIPCFFYLTYVRNPGAAFSLGTSLGKAAPLLFGVLNAVIIGVIVRIRTKAAVATMRRMFDLAMGFVLAGAVGNLIDRLYPPHQVVDFLD
ncbi:unnamed protein product, partial [marine sediment metagenome]